MRIQKVSREGDEKKVATSTMLSPLNASVSRSRSSDTSFRITKKKKTGEHVFQPGNNRTLPPHNTEKTEAIKPATLSGELKTQTQSAKENNEKIIVEESPSESSRRTNPEPKATKQDSPIVLKYLHNELYKCKAPDADDKTVTGISETESDRVTGTSESEAVAKISDSEVDAVEKICRHESEADTVTADSDQESENTHVDDGDTATESSSPQKIKDEQVEETKYTQAECLEKIREILEEVDTPTFVFSGKAENLPSSPGLRVEGIGPIALPILAQHAKALATIATHNGRVSADVPLEIEPSKVEIANPTWDSALKKLTSEASTALGVRHPKFVHTELRGLLLLQEGGSVKEHCNIEKDKNMFGTLMIQLSSQYEGGKFIVSHNGKTKEYSFGSAGSAAFDYHFLVYYAGCDHEIESLTSGHGLTLVYSLFYSEEYPKPTAATAIGKRDRLGRLMSCLDDDKKIFVLPLEYQYTSDVLSRLGVRALKGEDRCMADAIHAAGNEDWDSIIFEVTRTADAHRGTERPYKFLLGRSKLHLSLFKSLLDFRPPDQGGNLLVSSQSYRVLTQSDLGATKEFIRGSHSPFYVLIAFSRRKKVELFCRCNFGYVIRRYTSAPLVDASKITRIIQFLKSHAEIMISFRDFLALGLAIQKHFEGVTVYAEHLKTLIPRLHPSSFPSKEQCISLTSMIKHCNDLSVAEVLRSKLQDSFDRDVLWLHSILNVFVAVPCLAPLFSDTGGRAFSFEEAALLSLRKIAFHHSESNKNRYRQNFSLIASAMLDLAKHQSSCCTQSLINNVLDTAIFILLKDIDDIVLLNKLVLHVIDVNTCCKREDDKFGWAARCAVAMVEAILTNERNCNYHSSDPRATLLAVFDKKCVAWLVKYGAKETLDKFLCLDDNRLALYIKEIKAVSQSMSNKLPAVDGLLASWEMR